MVLLVIDTQKEVAGEWLYKFDEFVHNIQKLIGTARENHVEVVYVRHMDVGEGSMIPGKEGFEIIPEFAPCEGERIFDKTVNSAFRDCGLLEYLQEKGETTAMVTGLLTDYCIDATIKCGFEHKLNLFVPEYCNSTFDNEYMKSEESYKYYNEYMWKDRFAKCIAMDEAIKMLAK